MRDKRVKASSKAALLFMSAVLICFVPHAGVTGDQEENLLAQAAKRNYRGAGEYLGNKHRDPGGRFYIYPPAQWWKDVESRDFLARFSSRDYHAFMMIQAVHVSGGEPVRLDRDFTEFIHDKNKEVKESIPSYKVLSNRRVTLNKEGAYRTEATFQAGPNPVLINIYYIPVGTKIYMLSTVSPEKELRKWEPVFRASINTFTILE